MAKTNENQGTGQETLQGADFNWESDTFFGVKQDGTVFEEEDDEDVNTVLDKVKKEDSEEEAEFGEFGGNETPEVKKAIKKTDKKVIGKTIDDEDEDEEDEKPKKSAPKTASKQTSAEGKDKESEDDDSSDGDDFYPVLATELKGKEIFSEGLEIPKDLDEEGFINLVDKEVELRVEAALDEYDEALKQDKVAIAFLKFKKDGGSTAEFLKTFGGSELPSREEMKKPAVREKFLRQYYAEVEGLDAEDVEDKIEWLKEGKKLDKYADKYYTQEEEAQTEAQEQALAEAKERKATAEKNAIAFRDGMKKIISESDTINDIKLTPKDKKELPDYITKYSIKVGPTQMVTELQKKISDIFNSPKDLILLAKFVKAELKTTELEVSKASAKTNTARNTIRAAAQGRTNLRNTQQSSALADSYGN